MFLSRQALLVLLEAEAGGTNSAWSQARLVYTSEFQDTYSYTVKAFLNKYVLINKTEGGTYMLHVISM